MKNVKLLLLWLGKNALRSTKKKKILNIFDFELWTACVFNVRSKESKQRGVVCLHVSLWFSLFVIGFELKFGWSGLQKRNFEKQGKYPFSTLHKFIFYSTITTVVKKTCISGLSLNSEWRSCFHYFSTTRILFILVYV